MPHGWLKATLSLIKLKPSVHRSVEKRHGKQVRKGWEKDTDDKASKSAIKRGGKRGAEKECAEGSGIEKR